MTKLRQGVIKPVSLRSTSRSKASAMALGIGAALLATPALAQSAEPDEVELDTLRIEDKAADVNPYTQQGAPYKARVSGDPRRVKPLAETPATIQVLTATQIEESGETDLRDVLDGVPGVTVGTGENGNAFGDRYIIRGQEVRSDVFVDGLRDPGMTTRESFAVEQIEVTKGPSASFGGRGTTGGAVNSITKQASTDYNFNRVDLGAGTDNYWRGTLDSNWRISDDVAVRAQSEGVVPAPDPLERVVAGRHRHRLTPEAPPGGAAPRAAPRRRGRRGRELRYLAARDRVLCFPPPGPLVSCLSRGQLAQGESACFTRRRSLVQIQHCPPPTAPQAPRASPPPGARVVSSAPPDCPPPDCR